MGKKKQGMTPQTINILIYKNAIANGLRTTQKLPIQNVEQFDDMIKYNNNSMNSNFWHFFTQLISQLARMHKETDIAMTEWEQHFDKLQHGLIFDENNPDVIDTFGDDNCNEKLIQDDTGPSQNKIHDRHKTHSLDENAENMAKKLRAVPRHLNIDRKKRWTFNLDHKNHPTRHLIKQRKTKQNHKRNVKSFAYTVKKTFGIQKNKMSSI